MSKVGRLSSSAARRAVQVHSPLALRGEAGRDSRRAQPSTAGNERRNASPVNYTRAAVTLDESGRIG